MGMEQIEICITASPGGAPSRRGFAADEWGLWRLMASWRGVGGARLWYVAVMLPTDEAGAGHWHPVHPAHVRDLRALARALAALERVSRHVGGVPDLGGSPLVIAVDKLRMIRVRPGVMSPDEVARVWHDIIASRRMAMYARRVVHQISGGARRMVDPDAVDGSGLKRHRRPSPAVAASLHADVGEPKKEEAMIRLAALGSPWVRVQGDTIHISCPYHRDAIKAIKRIPSRRWVAGRKVWTVRGEHADSVAACLPLLDKIFVKRLPRTRGD